MTDRHLRRCAEGSSIDTEHGRLAGDAVGEVESEGNVLVLKRVRVTYRLAVDEDDDRDAIDRAFEVHESACPVYASLRPQIAITTSLELTPSPAP